MTEALQVLTMLFSDMEGSTRLLQSVGAGYTSVLTKHNEIIRGAIARHGGREIVNEGDGFFIAFDEPAEALSAALEAQLTLALAEWATPVDVRVRMGVHTGQVAALGSDFVGLAIHEAARISAAAHGGQVVVSEAIASETPPPDGASYRDLGPHRLKDLPDPIRIFQLTHPNLVTEFPALRSLGSTPHNLPSQISSFVGRTRDLSESVALVDEARLVTISGAGGIGKSRFATRLGAEVMPKFPDGVWWIDLVPAEDSTSLSTLAGRALQLDPNPVTTEQLAARLVDASALLIVDNVEHILDNAARFVDGLLRGCPHLKMLATGREPLGVTGEVVVRLATLETPQSGTTELTDLRTVDSIRLFVDRAGPGFELGIGNASAVANICRCLDGIPLAIELAAARAAVLGPDELERRLDQRFRLLTGGSRVVPRQRTLQATVDWSYDLLPEAEQCFFRQLGAFTGSFDLNAAAALRIEGDDIDAADLLTQLVSKSLVVPEQGRYRLLETLRQYAADKLVEHSELDEARDRHLAHFHALALAATEGGYILEPNDAFEPVLRAELDNLRQAFDWALGRMPVAAEDLASSCLVLWDQNAPEEGADRLRAALRAAPEEPHGARLRALYSCGCLEQMIPGRLDRAKQALAEAKRCLEALPELQVRCAPFVTHLEMCIVLREGEAAEALALAREMLERAKASGHPMALRFAHHLLGARLMNVGGYEARGHLEQALEIGLNLDSKDLEFDYLGLSGIAQAGGDTTEQVRLASRAFEIARDNHHWRSCVSALDMLASGWLAQDNPSRALVYAQESLSLARVHGFEMYALNTSWVFARIQQAVGDFAGAAVTLAESAERFEAAGDVAGSRALKTLAARVMVDSGDIATAVNTLVGVGQTLHSGEDAYEYWLRRCLRGFAEVAVALGDGPTAALLFAAGDKSHAERPIDPAELRRWTDLRNRARDLAGERFGAAHRRGEEMGPEAALQVAEDLRRSVLSSC